MVRYRILNSALVIFVCAFLIGGSYIIGVSDFNEGHGGLQIDGHYIDWLGTAPGVDNTDTISEGEYIWRDAVGDERTDSWSVEGGWTSSGNFDLTEFRMTADSTNLYFLVRVVDIDDGAGGGDGIPYVAISLDLDNTTDYSDTDLNWTGDMMDTGLGNASYYSEYNIEINLNDNVRVYNDTGSSWSEPGVAGQSWIDDSNNCIEARVPWSQLGGTPAPIDTLKFTVAMAHNDDGETREYTGSDALDLITDVPGNSWGADLDDGDIDYQFNVSVSDILDDADTVPPVFAGIASAERIGIESVRIGWDAASDTSNPITYHIYVNTSLGEDFSAAYDTTTGTTYVVSPLSTDRYYFWVRAEDAAGNREYNTVNLSRVTDSTPPVISNVANSTTDKSAVVTWDTDEPADSQVVWSKTPDLEPETDYVFVVAIDGARYTETFGDPTHQYVPEMWNYMVPNGTISNYFYNVGDTTTMSGHANIATGTYQYLPDDGSQRPTNGTFFEFARKYAGFAGQDVQIVTGKEKLKALNYSDAYEMGQSYAAQVDADYSAYSRDDNTTFANLTAVMAGYPRLTLVNFAETDLAGHSGNWSNYTSSIYNADRLVYDLWTQLQADPVYRDNTTLIVTSDHGRHDDDHGGFQDHGDQCEGCQHLMFLAIGPDIQKGVASDNPRYQVDILPTAGYLLGFPYYDVTGKPMDELFNDTQCDYAYVTAHSMTIQDLEPGTTYYYKLISRDRYGNVAVSPVYQLTTDVADVWPPAPPVNLTVTDAQNGYELDLDWLDNNETDLESYQVWRSTTSGSGYELVAVNGYHDIAIDGDGGDWAMDEVLGYDQGDNFNLTWNDTHLFISYWDMDLGSQGDVFLYLNTTAGGDPTTIDWGGYGTHTLPFGADWAMCLEDGGFYELQNASGGWHVDAYNGVVYGGWAGTPHTEASIPWTDIGGKPTQMDVVFFAQFETAANVYTAFPTTNPDGPAPVTLTDAYHFGDLGSDLASDYADVLGLVEGTTYYYVVNAVDNATSPNVSPPSGEANGTPTLPPATPADIMAYHPGDPTMADLDWTPNTEGDMAGYKVYRSTDLYAGYVEIADLPLTTDPITVDETFTANETDGYGPAAIDDTADEGGSSSEMDLVYATWDSTTLYFDVYNDGDVVLGSGADLFIAINTTNGGGASDPWDDHLYFSGDLPDYMIIVEDAGNEFFYEWTGTFWLMTSENVTSAGGGAGGKHLEVSFPLADIGSPAQVGYGLYICSETGDDVADNTAPGGYVTIDVLDSVVDANYTLLDISTDVEGAGADLGNLYATWNETHLFVAMDTWNTASWDTSYFFSFDTVPMSGYGVGGGDMWGRFVQFAGFEPEYQCAFWWDGASGTITGNDWGEWTGASWSLSPFGVLGVDWSYVPGPMGLTTIEFRIPWSWFGAGVPDQINMNAYICGGGGSSAVDSIPYDFETDFQNGGTSEWDDWDLFTMWTTIYPDRDQVMDKAPGVGGISGTGAPTLIELSSSLSGLDAPTVTDWFMQVDGSVPDTGWEQAEKMGTENDATLYVRADSANLYLAWRNADWTSEGDLFVYLNTQDGGNATANDWPASEPGNHTLPFEADYLYAIEDDAYQNLRFNDGAGWFDDQPFSGEAYVGSTTGWRRTTSTGTSPRRSRRPGR